MVNPVNTLDEGAVFLHELYVSYVRAGFTAEQALKIVIAMMAQNPAPSQGGENNAST